jgi:GNAT superfamily N-acetyltransferase
VKIIKLSPDDEVGCADAVAVDSAGWKLDCPELVQHTPRTFANMLRYGWDLEPPQAYLAREDDGTAVGLLVVEVSLYENTDKTWLDVKVHPDHRGRGIGSALFEYGEQVTRDLGRTATGLGGLDLPKAVAFAQRHGLEQKSVEVNRRQELTGLDWDLVQRMYDESLAAASAYELVNVVGALPDDMLEGMVAVVDSINDAPKDDLDLDDDVFTPERLRAYEEAQLKSDRTVYRVIARAKDTGELAAHTVVAVERERPHLGEQHDTAVSRDHRGHRLGALLKSAMLLWLREEEPALTQIDTWNAESNDHMISINEALNYHVVARFLDYQKTL